MPKNPPIQYPPRAYLDNPDKSPDAAPLIAVKAGESGFWPIWTGASAAELNERAGVSPEMAKAMHVGSMFGWDVPGADPACYNDRTPVAELQGEDQPAGPRPR